MSKVKMLKTRILDGLDTKKADRWKRKKKRLQW